MTRMMLPGSIIVLVVLAAVGSEPCRGDPPTVINPGAIADRQASQVASGPLPSPHVEHWSNSGCLLDDDGYLEWPCGEDEFELIVEGNTLLVVHRNATYNCCLDDIVISVSVEGNLLRLTEEEILTMECDCWCCYDIEATVVDLAPGTYTVEFCWFDYETWQVQCYLDEIVIPGLGDPPRSDPPVVIERASVSDLAQSPAAEVLSDPLPLPRVDNYSNSGCLLDDDGYVFWPCGDDEFTFTVDGHTLHVLHENATYNCCPDDIVISASLEGNLLRLTEEEILVQPCWCICCYDVEATVVDLPSGEYVVEFWWFDYETFEAQCHVEEIVIP